MKKSTLKPLVTSPTNQSREKRAAFLQEQIYGSVTLLAVNIGLLFKDNLSVRHAIITIAATAAGIWLASIFATVTAYRIVHNKNMQRDHLVHELTIHRGLLLAAVPSLIMLSLAAIELITIRTAVIVDICLALVGMTVAILRSAKTSTNSNATAAISVSLQATTALLIIGLMSLTK